MARAPGEAGPLEARIRGGGGAEERLALHAAAAALRPRVSDHRVHELLLEPAAAVLAPGEDRADDDTGGVDHVVAVGGGAQAVGHHPAGEGAPLDPPDDRGAHLGEVPAELGVPERGLLVEQRAELAGRGLTQRACAHPVSVSPPRRGTRAAGARRRQRERETPGRPGRAATGREASRRRSRPPPPASWSAARRRADRCSGRRRRRRRATPRCGRGSRTRLRSATRAGRPCRRRALAGRSDRDAPALARVTAVVVLRRAGAHLAGDSRPARPRPQAAPEPSSYNPVRNMGPAPASPRPRAVVLAVAFFAVSAVLRARARLRGHSPTGLPGDLGSPGPSRAAGSARRWPLARVLLLPGAVPRLRRCRPRDLRRRSGPGPGRGARPLPALGDRAEPAAGPVVHSFSCRGSARPRRPGLFPGRSWAVDPGPCALWPAAAKPYNSRSERTLARVVQGRGVGGAFGPAARDHVQPRPVRARIRPRLGLPSARPSPLPHPAARPGRRARRPGAERSGIPSRSCASSAARSERYEALDERLQAVPGALLRWLACRVTGVEEARPLFSANPWGALDPPRRARPPLPGVRAGPSTRPRCSWWPRRAWPSPSYPRSRPAPAAPAPAPAAAPAGARRLDPCRAVSRAARIWMADSGPGFELYSNGLRIDTTYAVAGEPWRYRVFEAGRGMGAEVPRPAGRDRLHTRRRATSGRSRSRSTRSCATRARTCCAT